MVIERGIITDFTSGPRDMGEGESRVHWPDCLVVPGFIDVHVHGVLGHDVLDNAEALARVAAALPRFGVTAFCPTSIACAPSVLSAFLTNVATLRSAAPERGARVLPAHLESNFISPDYKGAQPASCLRSPSAALQGARQHSSASTDFPASEILDVPAGRLHAWRIRLDHESFTPADVAHVWYGRSGQVKYRYHLVSIATDFNGNVVGRVVVEWDEALTAAALEKAW